MYLYGQIAKTDRRSWLYDSKDTKPSDNLFGVWLVICQHTRDNAMKQDLVREVAL
ncbi:unnamed protein product [Acidithrix sp. C25]|nr:unnamed protein product [Acidithrix sp. C25]